jgi:hypothetical protein
MTIKSMTVFIDWEDAPKELLQQLRANIMDEFKIDAVNVHFETDSNTHGINHARIEYSTQIDAIDYEANAVVLQDIVDNGIIQFEERRDREALMEEYDL